MRWFDEYLGLLAAASGFGAVVAWGAGAGWLGTGSFLVLAAVALALMAWQVVRTPRVVLVGEPARRPLYRLREELDEAGFGFRTCPGPATRPCPVLDGKPCPVGGHPVAAVIFRRRGDAGPLPPCGIALGVPAMSVQEGSDEPPAVGPRRAHLGWGRGPVAAVDTLGALLGR